MPSSEKDKKVARRQSETVRERAERAIKEASKPKKTDKVTAAPKKRLKVLSLIKRDNKSDKKQKKEKKSHRFHFTPKFIRNSFTEIRFVTWPNRLITFKLTVAVILFATVFGTLISLVDYAFGHIFKRIFLHG